MSQKNQVSFKVSLFSDDSAKIEVRRVVVPQDVSTSLVYIKEKLRSLFGLQSNFKLSWMDQDGDEVTVDSDEELIIAMQEMKGPVYKLNIKSSMVANDNPGEVHHGVRCDGCEGQVSGFRYKCTVCPNYDLCSKCERSGLHPGHNMIRISTPDNVWPRHFFRRFCNKPKKCPRFDPGLQGQPDEAFADLIGNIVNSAQHAFDPFGIDVKAFFEAAKEKSKSTEVPKDDTKPEETAEEKPGDTTEASNAKDQDDSTKVMGAEVLYPNLDGKAKVMGAEALYPNLDDKAKVASHPNPKIKLGLQAMENMGFSNEGGWLTSLLERFDGDIGKVLDILKPVKA